MDHLSVSGCTEPVRATRTRRTVAWRVAPLVAALALGVTGCATGDGSTATPSPTAGPRPTRPGAVALEYSDSLFSGRFDRASSLVLPRERGVMKVLFTGMTQSSVRAQGLGVGSVHTKADTGTVVLTGKMCSSPVIPKGSTVSPHSNEKCVENHQRDGSNPAFLVTLCRSSGKWYVCFPKFDEAVKKGSASSSGSGSGSAPAGSATAAPSPSH